MLLQGQYEFLHEAVLEAYNSRDTRMETAAFDSAFPHTIRHDAPHQRIDAEFEVTTFTFKFKIKILYCPLQS